MPSTLVAPPSPASSSAPSRGAGFPTTQVGMIESGVAGCDVALHTLRDYVYRVYHAPLVAYYRSTSWFRAYGRCGDWTEEEIVHGFITERCLRPRFWRGYLGSGKRLRRYLMSGLLLYLHERYRLWLKHRPGLYPPPEPEYEPEPGEAADCLMVRGLVLRAFNETLGACARQAAGTTGACTSGSRSARNRRSRWPPGWGSPPARSSTWCG